MIDPKDLIDLERRTVSPRVFSDPEVHQAGQDDKNTGVVLEIVGAEQGTGLFAIGCALALVCLAITPTIR